VCGSAAAGGYTTHALRKVDEQGGSDLIKIETLLPLGKVDPGLRASATPLDVTAVFGLAKVVENLGYDGVVFEETKDYHFVLSTLAAMATSHLGVGTAVAIAFPRSPTVIAMSAWSLQKLSKGRCLATPCARVPLA
jgi:hypothetical protein